MSTETRTTTGWMPTVLAMTRGCTMFMVTNQPTAMTMMMGMSASGWVSMAATTGGAQETKGPKKGIIWKMATSAVVRGTKSMPSAMLPAAATAP